MWKQLLESLSSQQTYFPPANNEAIRELEQAFGVALPAELLSLLAESNGVYVNDGLRLIWPVEVILQENIDYRGNPEFKDIYMPFEPLLFFGDAGNGDQFAFVILDGIIRTSHVYAWNHEDDSRNWVAPSVKKYVEWWLNGTIKL